MHLRSELCQDDRRHQCICKCDPSGNPVPGGDLPFFLNRNKLGTFAILVPIAIAMFPSADNMQMMIIAVSAVLSGAVCGDHVSPISDTTVMSSAGAQSNHINHVTTQMQYAAVVAVVSAVGFLLAGFVHVWWIVLGVSLILLLAVLTVLRKVAK